MKWLVKDYKGEMQLWYSEDEVKKLEEKIKDLEENKKIILGNGRTLSKLCSKYRQALNEIKHNAEVQIECLDYEIKNDCFSQIRCKALQQQIYFLKEEILQEFTKLHEER